MFQRWERELVEGEPWDTLSVNRVDWSHHWYDCWEIATNRTRNVSCKSKISNVNRLNIASSQNL
jgi:hypothetical protein